VKRARIGSISHRRDVAAFGAKRVGELLGDRLADLDAVLPPQETTLRARIADDAGRLDLLVAVRRRLAAGEALSVDDLIHLT
jgi:hypothetical protein